MKSQAFIQEDAWLSLVRLWICMVEARGVEPLSEGNATQVSTGVVTVLSSPGRSPRNRLSPGPAWLSSSVGPRRRPIGAAHYGYAPKPAHGRCRPGAWRPLL